VGKTLTADAVRQIGRALGHLAREKEQQAIAVGCDGRLFGPELAEALMEGICMGGADAIDIGCAPAPVTYFAAHELDCHSCVSVTGSHNPPDYNGLKMVIGGETLALDAIQALKTRIESGRFGSSQRQGQRREADVRAAYLERIVGDVKLARPMKIIMDCGNGVAGSIAPELFRRLGCAVTPLFCEVDGRFPNPHPDPSKLLDAWIREHGGKPLMWNTAHALIKAKLKETGAPLAGVLEILSRYPDANPVLRALPKAISTPELNIRIAEGEPVALVEKLKAAGRFTGEQTRLTIDGLRIEYADGFGLARSSNTTLAVVLRFEADNATALAHIQEDFRRALTNVWPRVILPF
jgi:phosphomannomutase